MNVAFHTLGCKVNQYDTQAMLEKFVSAGYTVVPFESRADVYVVNTCTVTGTGDKKSMQLARHLKRLYPDCKLILCGCLAQKKGEALLSTGADVVLGTQSRAKVVELLEQCIQTGTPVCEVRPLGPDTPYEPLYITTQTERTRATLKIQEGCNNRCTYCIIPSVRGPIRSRPLRDICTEATRLSQSGFSEIVLTGIHLSSYGRDLHDGTSLLDVLRMLQDIPGVSRIRLGSLEPTVATEEFAREVKRLDKVCPQFHLALQSGSDSVLRRMKRQYNTAMYSQAVENIRKAFPMAALTTDILTGFPGETEEEYQETRDYIRQIGFSRIHVFPYSRREDTPAAVMPGQLTAAVKEQRARELISLGNEVAASYLASWTGMTTSVLLEDQEDGKWVGYTPEYIRVSLPSDPQLQNGQTVSVRLTDVQGSLMHGIVIPSNGIDIC